MTAWQVGNAPARANSAGRTTRMALAAAALLILAIVYASAARAETSCLPYDKAVEHLKATYAEAPVAMGVTSTGQLVQLFRANGGETWTLVVVSPDGLACALAEGEIWSDLPAMLAGRTS